MEKDFHWWTCVPFKWRRFCEIYVYSNWYVVSCLQRQH